MWRVRSASPPLYRCTRHPHWGRVVKAPDTAWKSQLLLIMSSEFLSFFLGWRIPNLIFWLVGGEDPNDHSGPNSLSQTVADLNYGWPATTRESAKTLPPPPIHLNRQLLLLVHETHSLRACISLCPSSNHVLSLLVALDIRLFLLIIRLLSSKLLFPRLPLWCGNLDEPNTRHIHGLLRIW